MLKRSRITSVGFLTNSKCCDHWVNKLFKEYSTWDLKALFQNLQSSKNCFLQAFHFNFSSMVSIPLSCGIWMVLASTDKNPNLCNFCKFCNFAQSCPIYPGCPWWRLVWWTILLIYQFSEIGLYQNMQQFRKFWGYLL